MSVKVLLDGKVLGVIHKDNASSAIDALRKCKLGLDGPRSQKGQPLVSPSSHHNWNGEGGVYY